MHCPKTNCFYHKEQSITNFCRDKNCLMPLCPNCIGEHSAYHEANGTRPHYLSIYEIMTEVERMLFNSVSALEKDRLRVSELSRRVKSLDDFVHQKLNSTKRTVLAIVEDTFKELEESLKKALSSLHQDTGLHSPTRIDKFEQQLAETLNELYEISEGLKGTKSLGHVILFLKEKEKDYSSFQGRLGDFLDANERYEPKIEGNQEAVSSLSYCVSRMLRVETRKDIDRRKQKDKESRSRRGNKDFQDKNDKIERSYTPQRSASYLKQEREKEVPKPQPPVKHSNTPYYPNTISSYFIGTNPSYREMGELGMERSRQPSPGSGARLSQLTPSTQQTSRIRDFKQQYQNLSRKVSQMRRQNQLITRKYK